MTDSDGKPSPNQIPAWARDELILALDLYLKHRD